MNCCYSLEYGTCDLISCETYRDVLSSKISQKLWWDVATFQAQVSWLLNYIVRFNFKFFRLHSHGMLSDFWKIQVVNYLPEHPLNLMIQDMRTSVLEQGIGEQSSSYFTLHPQGWSCHSVTSPASRVAHPNFGNNALPECLFWAQDGTWHPDAPDLPHWVNMTLGTSVLHPTEHEEGGLQEMYIF